MQLGAAFSGAAIENSMLGIAHSCANPLTAHFGIVHGQAVGVMLPHVVKFNSRDPESKAIYRAFHPDLAARVKDLLKIGGMKVNLSGLNFDRKKLTRLSEEAAGQWTAQFNPIAVTPTDLREIYQNAL
jgi:alcohol dehydrogenase